MRSTLTLAAVLAALALVGCTPEPRVQVLPEALPTVSSAIKQTTITAPTPTKTTPTIAALASYECRDANAAEIGRIASTGGKPQKTAAVDLGEGWSIVAYVESKRDLDGVAILTNGSRFTSADRSRFTSADAPVTPMAFLGYVFEGGAAARSAAYSCLS